MQSFIPFLHRQNAFFVEELVKDPAAYLEVARRCVGLNLQSICHIFTRSPQ